MKTKDHIYKQSSNKPNNFLVPSPSVVRAEERHKMLIVRRHLEERERNFRRERQVQPLKVQLLISFALNWFKFGSVNKTTTESVTHSHCSENP